MWEETNKEVQLNSTEVTCVRYSVASYKLL